MLLFIKTTLNQQDFSLAIYLVDTTCPADILQVIICFGCQSMWTTTVSDLYSLVTDQNFVTIWNKQNRNQAGLWSRKWAINTSPCRPNETLEVVFNQLISFSVDNHRLHYPTTFCDSTTLFRDKILHFLNMTVYMYYSCLLVCPNRLLTNSSRAFRR